MTPSDASFKADRAERLLGPLSVLSRPDPNRFAAFLGAGVLYAILLSFVLFENRLDPSTAPTPVEIPVEIVVEPPTRPKPDVPPTKPQPQATTQPFYEEPAFDAPRAANNEKLEADAPGEKPNPPPPSSATSASADNPTKIDGKTKGGEREANENSIESVLDKSLDETLPPVDPNHDSSKQQAALEAEAEPSKRASAEPNQFPTFDSVPDVDFGSAARPTPIAGGKARSTYLSILYAMIMNHMRSHARFGPSRAEGTIDFTLDAMGNLIQRRIGRSSGSHDLDNAALDAIGEASPFPPPPQGAPIGLRFSYGSK